jgi:hypothetical protein
LPSEATELHVTPFAVVVPVDPPLKTTMCTVNPGSSIPSIRYDCTERSAFAASERTSVAGLSLSGFLSDDEQPTEHAKPTRTSGTIPIRSERSTAS